MEAQSNDSPMNKWHDLLLVTSSSTLSVEGHLLSSCIQIKHCLPVMCEKSFWKRNHKDNSVDVTANDNRG